MDVGTVVNGLGLDVSELAAGLMLMQLMAGLSPWLSMPKYGVVAGKALLQLIDANSRCGKLPTM